MKTPNLVQKLRAFFSEKKFSLRWLAHLSLVELLITCIVLVPSMATNAAFTDGNGDFTIWVDAGRVHHGFGIEDGVNSPNNFPVGILTPPHGTKITGNNYGAGNGMWLRDLATNDVVQLPDDANGNPIVIPPGAWTSPAPQRVFFVVNIERAYHQLVVIHPNGTTYPATWSSMSFHSSSFGDGSYGELVCASALIDPGQPFRIADLTTLEQNAEGQTFTPSYAWEPFILPPPVVELRVVLPAFAAAQNYTVHTQVPSGPVSHSAHTALGNSYWYDWSINGNAYFSTNSCGVLTFSAPVGAAFWITSATGERWPLNEGTQTVPEQNLAIYSFDALDFPAPPPPPMVAVTLRINAEWFLDPVVWANLASHHWQLWTNAGMIAERYQVGSYDYSTFSSQNTEYVTTHEGQAIDNPISILTLTAQVPEGADWWMVDVTAGNTYEVGRSEFLNGWQPHIPIPAVASSLDIHADRLRPPGFDPSYISIGIAPASTDYSLDASNVRWISGAMLNGATPAGTITHYDREFWNEITYEGYTLPYTHLEFGVPGEWGSSYVLVIKNDAFYGYVVDELSLPIGATDDTTWLPAPQPVYLNISESRWGHNLVLRHVDGREYPIFPGQTQGDTSWNPASASHAWQNSYYYFDANTQATPGMDWRIVDKTAGDEAGVGETNLIEWIFISRPDLREPTLKFAPLGVVLEWDSTYGSDETAAVEIQRKTVSNGLSAPWDPLTIIVATVDTYSDESVLPGSMYDYRIRGIFGANASGWSAVRRIPIPFNIDSDGDGIDDTTEGTNGTNPFLADSDGDGVSDSEELAQGLDPNDADSDGDGFKDGEDRWPKDPRRGDFIPPKFFAVTDLSATLPQDSQWRNNIVGMGISDDNEVSWVARGSYVDGEGVNRPMYKSHVYKDGVLTEGETLADGDTITHTGEGTTSVGKIFGFTLETQPTLRKRESLPISVGIVETADFDGLSPGGSGGSNVISEFGNYATTTGLTEPRNAPYSPGAAVGIHQTGTGYQTELGQPITAVYEVWRRRIPANDSPSGLQYFSLKGNAPYVGTPDPLQPLGVFKEPVLSAPSQNGNVLIGFQENPAFEDEASIPNPPPLPPAPKNWLWLEDGREIEIPGDGIAVNNEGQVIAMSNPDPQTGERHALFVWMESGTVKQTRLQNLLQWADKPPGVKDDYDRYFARTAKNDQPAQPQIRNIVPVWISDVAKASDGTPFPVNIVSRTATDGVPQRIVMTAEVLESSTTTSASNQSASPSSSTVSTPRWVRRHIDMEIARSGVGGFHYRMSVHRTPAGEFAPTAVNSLGELTGILRKRLSQTTDELAPPVPAKANPIQFVVEQPGKDKNWATRDGTQYLNIANLLDHVIPSATPGPTKLAPFENQNDITTSALNVAECHDSFRIRVKDSRTAETMSVFLWTSNETIKRSNDTPNTDYDDPVTEITLTNMGDGIFVSKSLVLVSDKKDDEEILGQIADEAKDDRTHIAAVGSVVSVSTTANGSADALALVPWNFTLKVLPVWVQLNNGNNSDAQNTALHRDTLKQFRERYASASIRILDTPVRQPINFNPSYTPATAVIGTIHFEASSDALAILAEVVPSLTEIAGVKQNSLPVIYCEFTNNNAFGNSLFYSPGNKQYFTGKTLAAMGDFRSLCFVDWEDKNTLTAAHEGLHCLLFARHDGVFWNDQKAQSYLTQHNIGNLKSRYNLWAPHTNSSDNFKHRKRISDEHRTDMQENLTLRNFSPLVKEFGPEDKLRLVNEK